MKLPDISQINLENMRERYALLKSAIIHTPTVSLLSQRLEHHLDGANISLKLECLQNTGTFKARGALSVAHSLTREERQNGITAVSAGNHAIAAAWAARQISTSAKVVMQSTANPYRVALARSQEAEIILKEPGAPSFAEAERLVREEKRALIHPFEGPYTTLGAAGVGLELMADLENVEAVVVAVGGGGLISGVSAAVKAINPHCKVYGVEPEGADSMSQSFAKGQPVTLDKVYSIADSLAPPMALPFGFAICQRNVDEMVTVSDEEICAGVVLLQEDAKLAVEPAAGAALAGALGPLRDKLSGRNICILICGANIDTQTFTKVLVQGQHSTDKLLRNKSG